MHILAEGIYSVPGSRFHSIPCNYNIFIYFVATYNVVYSFILWPRIFVEVYIGISAVQIAPSGIRITNLYKTKTNCRDAKHT